jgi:hypothetical protein
MPAAFITLTDKDVFKNGGAASHLLQIPKLDSIIGKEGLGIYNSASVQLAETIQYFLTFDDVIKFIHFGRGLGSINIDGTLFCNDSGSLPGAAKFIEAVTALRGQPQDFTFGPLTLTGILTGMQYTVVGEPDTMVHFVVNFAVVNHH